MRNFPSCLPTELADYAAGDVHGMAADAIREQLGQQFPDIAALNQEYSFWRNVNQVVGDTITRHTGQAKPLGQKLASAAGTAAGFATGSVGGAALGREAMQALKQGTTSTAGGTVSAVMKDRLADALGSGDTKRHRKSRGSHFQRAAVQSSTGDEEGPPPSATRYRQAQAQPQPQP